MMPEAKPFSRILYNLRCDRLDEVIKNNPDRMPNILIFECRRFLYMHELDMPILINTFHFYDLYIYI